MIKVFSMAYDFDNDEFDDEELANFVATHRVKYIRKEFFVTKDISSVPLTQDMELYCKCFKKCIFKKKLQLPLKKPFTNVKAPNPQRSEDPNLRRSRST